MDTEKGILSRNQLRVLSFCDFPAPGTIYVGKARPPDIRFGQMPQGCPGGW